MKAKDLNAKWNQIADIFSDVAQVFLASVVIPAILDISDWPLLLFGIVVSCGFWIISVLIKRKE